MLGGAVANRSTTIFEPHSKEESLLRALVAVPGLGGLGGSGGKSRRPCGTACMTALAA